MLGSGIARGAAKRGKRVAFGDRKRIIWHPNAYAIFDRNPNVAMPGQEGYGNLEWVEHYSGARAYCRRQGTRWAFNPDFRATPGEVFLTPDELRFAHDIPRGFIVIEPNTKHSAPNKQWSIKRYQCVAQRLMRDGYTVVQFRSGASVLEGVRTIAAPTFRHALAVLARAALYIGPEGGLHHGCAAVGVRAVVLFGGFISPATTGYATHANLFTADEACGETVPCDHCRRAMDAITIDQVYSAAKERLACGA